jgi:hypothetical protein
MAWQRGVQLWSRDLGSATLLLIALCVLPSVAARGADRESELIFDGVTLKGWDGDPDHWSVEDGAITGQTTTENPLEHNTFLIWREGKVGDFELTLEFRIVGGNSGIQYRSWEDPGKLGKWVVGGYQADIDSPREPRWCGVLYEEQGRQFLAQRGQRTIVKEDHKPEVIGTIGDPDELYSHINFEGWNTYHILAKGHHFIHEINGQRMIESTDEDTTARRNSGLLAFQLHHGEPMKLQIRNVRLTRY